MKFKWSQQVEKYHYWQVTDPSATRVRGLGLRGLGFRGLGGLGFRGLGVQGLGLRVWGSSSGPESCDALILKPKIVGKRVPLLLRGYWEPSIEFGGLRCNNVRYRPGKLARVFLDVPCYESTIVDPDTLPIPTMKAPMLD